MNAAMKAKTRLHRRHQDVGSVRAIGYLPKRTVGKEQNQPGRERCVVVSKTGRTKPPKPFDIRHGMVLQE